MNETYTKQFQISTTSMDRYGHCRPSALLEIIQELASDHSDALRINRDYLVENYNACWILARVWYRLERPLYAGQTLTATTWHRGAGGLIVYRDTDLYVGKEFVGEAVGAWVVADLESRKMLRPGSVENIADSPVPQRVKDRQLRLIRTPKERKTVCQRTVRYSDLDVNGHMNNTKYADALLDAFTSRELEGKYISELQLNYSQECLEGETMGISRLMEGNSCYIDGCSEDGKRRFEAMVQFSPDPEMGLDGDTKSE